MAIIVAGVVGLALFGFIGAALGGARVLVGALRVMIGGVLAGESPPWRCHPRRCRGVGGRGGVVAGGPSACTRSPTPSLLRARCRRGAGGITYAVGYGFNASTAAR